MDPLVSQRTTRLGSSTARARRASSTSSPPWARERRKLRRTSHHRPARGWHQAGGSAGWRCGPRAVPAGAPCRGGRPECTRRRPSCAGARAGCSQGGCRRRRGPRSRRGCCAGPVRGGCVRAGPRCSRRHASGAGGRRSLRSRAGRGRAARRQLSSKRRSKAAHQRRGILSALRSASRTSSGSPMSMNRRAAAPSISSRRPTGTPAWRRSPEKRARWVMRSFPAIIRLRRPRAGFRCPPRGGG